jgi:hypothetical protein
MKENVVAIPPKPPSTERTGVMQQSEARSAVIIPLPDNNLFFILSPLLKFD